jgi:hypothetical protein
VNLADARADRNRRAGLDLLSDGPDRVIHVLRRLRESANAVPSLFPEHAVAQAALAPLPHLHMPAHHDVRVSDVVLKRLHAALAAAAERGPGDFTDVLLTPGVGARTVSALALVAEVLHGAPCRFSDPARFSLAHGGKDGHPFPVPLRVYDETLRVLKSAVAQAKLGNADKLAAIRRLDTEARLLEGASAGPGFDGFIARERSDSRAYGGRSVQPGRPGRRRDERDLSRGPVARATKASARRSARQLTLDLGK